MSMLTFFRKPLTIAVMAGSLAMVAASGAHANDTIALKNALYGAGYAVSNVSPQMDDATRNALTKFQKDNGLTASGVLDQSTKEALGMVSVQVAASSSSNSGGSSQASSSDASSDPAPAAQAEEDDIEEDDDGGWSLF